MKLFVLLNDCTRVCKYHAHFVQNLHSFMVVYSRQVAVQYFCPFSKHSNVTMNEAGVLTIGNAMPKGDPIEQRGE